MEIFHLKIRLKSNLKAKVGIINWIIFVFAFSFILPTPAVSNKSSTGSHDYFLPGIEISDQTGFSTLVSSSEACELRNFSLESKQQQRKSTLKLYLKHRITKHKTQNNTGDTLKLTKTKDLLRIQTLHKRITEKKNQNVSSRLKENKTQLSRALSENVPQTRRLEATLESGLTLGSGEYFMDVFIGTPPKHFSLILDTGSDLNWVQCLPCHDCFDQNGPHYNPQESSSFHPISCKDPRCHLVSSPDPPQSCNGDNQTCPYFYWYGDQSNTTGDFALETFTVNLTSSIGETEFKQIENIMFGCGHWNKGYFHGASGLLGLGRGPLSFSSQMQHLYGNSFSYCLVDRNSDMSVRSKLILGREESLMSHPHLNFTSFVGGKENPVDTYYYVQIKSILVGGERLNISEETWIMSSEGVGGTIIDSGTTLSYFVDPAYEIIKDAFEKKMNYKKVDIPILDCCYDVSGVEKVKLPEFSIIFADDAMWNFPMENYFLRIEPEDVVCLMILGTNGSPLSILGNYQQQNFHVSYDIEKSRLGFAPMKCSDI